MNVNHVVITGNLTKDPELVSNASSTTICRLRVAVNTRRKDGDSWIDKPNYFDVTVFGKQGETAAEYLSKGSRLAVDGRLDWREWETDEGQKRQAVGIIANHVEFLTPKNNDAGPTETAGEDEDIPF